MHLTFDQQWQRSINRAPRGWAVAFRLAVATSRRLVRALLAPQHQPFRFLDDLALWTEACATHLCTSSFCQEIAVKLASDCFKNFDTKSVPSAKHQK